jgi:hypothetical protein
MVTSISLCEAILEREAAETRDCTDIKGIECRIKLSSLFSAKGWRERAREDEERRADHVRAMWALMNDPGKVGDTIKIRLPERYR